jgi:hypothetical protein
VNPAASFRRPGTGGRGVNGRPLQWAASARQASYPANIAAPIPSMARFAASASIPPALWASTTAFMAAVATSVMSSWQSFRAQSQGVTFHSHGSHLGITASPDWFDPARARARVAAPAQRSSTSVCTRAGRKSAPKAAAEHGKAAAAETTWAKSSRSLRPGKCCRSRTTFSNAERLRPARALDWGRKPTQHVE